MQAGLAKTRVLFIKDSPAGNTGKTRVLLGKTGEYWVIMDIPTLITALTLTCHVNGYTSVQQWRYKYRYSTRQEENQIPPISEFVSREDRKYILRDRRNIAKTRQSSAINSQFSADFLLQIPRRIGELLPRIGRVLSRKFRQTIIANLRVSCTQSV